MNVWDTAGQETYKSLTTKFYRDADAVILVFDFSRIESFKGLDEWLSLVRDHCLKDPYKILVGNKCDRDQKVPYSDIEVIFGGNLTQFNTKRL